MPKDFKAVETTVVAGDLTSWRAHCTEMHDFLLEAGLEWESDIGTQLDFTDEGITPIVNDYAGYRIYRINDDYIHGERDIFIRIDFGWASEGIRQSTASLVFLTPRVKVTIGNNVTPTGVCRCGNVASSIVGHYPHGSLSAGTGNIGHTVTPTVKLYNFDSSIGMYYLVFNLNARGNVHYASNPYNGCSLAILIQRSLSPYGHVTDEGFTCYMSDLASGTDSNPISARWPDNYNIPNIAWTGRIGSYSYNSQIQNTSKRFLQHAGYDITPGSDGIIAVSPTFTWNSSLAGNPNMVLYNGFAMGERTEFSVETAPGVSSTYKALGAGTGIFFGENGAGSHIAIKWD